MGDDAGRDKTSRHGTLRPWEGQCPSLSGTANAIGALSAQAAGQLHPERRGRMSTIEYVSAFIGICLTAGTVGAEVLGYLIPRPIAGLLFGGGLVCIVLAVCLPVERYFEGYSLMSETIAPTSPHITLFSISMPDTPDVLGNYSEPFNEGLAAGKHSLVIEWGDSAVFFNIIGAPQGPLSLPFLKGASLSIDNVSGALKVSATIRSKIDNSLVADIIGNHLKAEQVNSETHAIYNTDDALEVVDEHQKVVLQVKLLPQRVQLQGEWWSKSQDGAMRGIRIGKYPYQCPQWYPDRFSSDTPCIFMQNLTLADDPDEPHIERMFQLGEPRKDLRAVDGPAPSQLQAETQTRDIALQHGLLILFPSHMIIEGSSGHVLAQ
jgi:hypothetical protein